MGCGVVVLWLWVVVGGAPWLGWGSRWKELLLAVVVNGVGGVVVNGVVVNALRIQPCALRTEPSALRIKPSALRIQPCALRVKPVSYTHLTLPTKRIV